jgi:hypothetical protein
LLPLTSPTGVSSASAPGSEAPQLLTKY